MTDSTLVDKARALLGDKACLVPCGRGSKVPLQSYRDRPTDSFFTPAWLSIFEVENANVAVLLGERSDNLVAIDFDDESRGYQFDAANPDLVGTLRTTGARGWQLWLRLHGPYPRSVKTQQCEWRANGNLSMFAGLHPAGMEYRILQDAKPSVVSWAQINWPDGWEVPGSDDSFEELTKQYGPPYWSEIKKDGEKPTKLNEAFWAGLYAHENRLLFLPDESRFYAYRTTTGLWEPEPTPTVTYRISDRLLRSSREMNVPWLAKQRDSAKLFAISKQLEGITCKSHAFRKEMDFLHVANGILVWRGDDFVFEPFSADWYSRNASPVSYVPNARCPRFMDELLFRSLRSQDVDLLQKFAGLFLLGKNIIQRMLILEGASGTGKSQIGAVIRGLVGTHNVANLRTDQLGERFEMAYYLQKSLLIGSDVPENFFRARGISQVKAMLGGDQLMAEIKGSSESKEIFGHFNILVTANCRLRLRLENDVEAWRRRLTVISFESEPPKTAIPDFGNVLLREEGPGILNWAIDGLRILFAEMKANNGRLKLDEVQQQHVDRMLCESDSLRVFLKQNVRWDATGDLSVDEIAEAYHDWCSTSDMQSMGHRAIQNMLPSLMLELFTAAKSNDIQRRGKAARGFRNVAFRSDGDASRQSGHQSNESENSNEPF
jgi:phage/plasmid-associated DNA primase